MKEEFNDGLFERYCTLINLDEDVRYLATSYI